MLAKSQSTYDGFVHLIESIEAKPETLMPMFTLYCDDSGTHAKSDVAIAGCYVSTVEQWREFKRNWEEIDAKEHFGVFHMADFVAKRKQFAFPEWQDDKKRDRTIRALVATINTRVRIGIAAAVVKSAYNEIVPANMREHLGRNHYTFAVRMCIAFVEQWRKQYGYSEPIQYVFDRLTKGKGDIEEAFSLAASGGEDAVRRYGIHQDGWSFQNKENVTQLQAADIWAYENYRYAVDTFFAPADQRKNMRNSYRILRGHPLTVVRYTSRESLSKLVRRLHESDSLGEIIEDSGIVV